MTGSQVQRLIRGATAQLSGKSQRGPDHDPNRTRRVPRRYSYEVSDPRANPWARIGDGSVREGLLHQEAKVETADELRRKLWADYPRAEVRRRRRERDLFVAELAELMSRSPADVPTGRPATLRIAIAKHGEWLFEADSRLRRIDVDVYRAVLSFLDFSTGRLFPKHEKIAERAGVHENSVIEALKRLRKHGLLDWVRRTVRTGNEGEFGPQLEQTSNAYFFDHRRKMSPRTWQSYWKRLCAKLKRLGAKRPQEPSPQPLETAAKLLTDYQQAFVDLGASIANATT